MNQLAPVDAVALNAELSELREKVRVMGLELAEVKAFFREVTDQLSLQVKELKANANHRDGGFTTPPRLIPQR